MRVLHINSTIGANSGVKITKIKLGKWVDVFFL